MERFTDKLSFPYFPAQFVVDPITVSLTSLTSYVFTFCWDVVLKIITLKSQVEQLQRLLSNLKVIKTTEAARKYHRHWILRSSVKLSLVHSDSLHIKINTL